MPINSKNGETVRVTQKWNGYRLNIRYLLEDFYISLCNQRVQELKDRYRIPKKIGILKLPSGGNGNKIKWIENLLLTPLTDYRKFAIWRVLSPYLLNIRGLSQGDAYDIIRLWLEECNRICRLDFIPDHRVKAALKGSRDFLPISSNKLKVENEGFYRLLQDNGVVI